MILGGGAAVNKMKIRSEADIYHEDDLINDKYFIVQKGKKNYFLIIAE